MEVSINSLMQNLSISDQTLPTLVKIKAFLASSSSSNFKNVLQISQVGILFGCLETTNKEQIDITCFLLNTLLPALNSADVVTKLSEPIQNCLNHANADVQLLALKQLNHIATSYHGLNALSESPEMITMAVKLVGSESLAVASAAVHFLSDYGRASPSKAFSLLNKGQDSHLKLIKSVMAKGDEVRYRVFELICNIQAESQEMLSLCVDSGIVDELIKDLAGDDILLRVSCCAMLANMASSQHAMAYLDQRGVVSSMIELLKTSQNDPLSNLYVPGIIKFFGNLCLYSGPNKVLGMYPGYFNRLFSMLSEGDQNTKRIAIETLGIIGRSAEGKLLLSDQGSKGVAAMKQICHILLHGAQDVRLYAVDAMCMLLDVSLVTSLFKVLQEELDQITPITLSWFRLISDDPIGSVIEMCKQPFPAIRCSAFNLLKTIAKCDWGLEAMVELSYLTEFLLDRSTETDKECKEAKFEVVEAICASKRCPNVFGNQNYLKFRQFVKEGPFYVETQLNVAIEEA